MLCKINLNVKYRRKCIYFNGKNLVLLKIILLISKFYPSQKETPPRGRLTNDAIIGGAT